MRIQIQDPYQCVSRFVTLIFVLSSVSDPAIKPPWRTKSRRRLQSPALPPSQAYLPLLKVYLYPDFRFGPGSKDLIEYLRIQSGFETETLNVLELEYVSFDTIRFYFYAKKTVIVILKCVSFCRSQEAEAPCLWCSCVNGLRQGEARWRYETWVTALAALAGTQAVIHLLAQGHNSSSPERLT